MAISPIAFIRESVDELRKVVWPTKQEIIRLTIAVLIISLVVGLFLGGIDFLLTKTIDVVLR